MGDFVAETFDEILGAQLAARDWGASPLLSDRKAIRKLSAPQLALPTAGAPASPDTSALPLAEVPLDVTHLIRRRGPAHLPSRVIEAPVRERRVPKRRGQAKTFGDAEFHNLLRHIDGHSSERLSGRAMLTLSYLQGLRPIEIAGLSRRAVLTATGEIKEYLEVMPGTSKRGRGRILPMHDETRAALVALFEAHPDAAGVAFYHFRGMRLYRDNSGVSQWFNELYRSAGMLGCMGMSGRRSFATELIKRGASPADVQRLLGHKSLNTTSLYVESSDDCANLICSLGRK